VIVHSAAACRKQDAVLLPAVRCVPVSASDVVFTLDLGCFDIDSCMGTVMAAITVEMGTNFTVIRQQWGQPCSAVIPWGWDQKFSNFHILINYNILIHYKVVSGATNLK
jgi:hypothetical protein